MFYASVLLLSRAVAKNHKITADTRKSVTSWSRRDSVSRKQCRLHTSRIDKFAGLASSESRKDQDIRHSQSCTEVRLLHQRACWDIRMQLHSTHVRSVQFDASCHHRRSPAADCKERGGYSRGQSAYCRTGVCSQLDASSNGHVGCKYVTFSSCLRA